MINNFFLGLSPTMQTVVYTAIAIWSIIWKGLALWKASKKSQKYWFVALLVINTMGLLEISYIYYFSKRKSRKKGK